MKGISFGLALLLQLSLPGVADAQFTEPATFILEPDRGVALQPIAATTESDAAEPGQMSLKAALDRLVAETNLPLVYSASVPGATRVSCACSQATPREALERLLAGTEFWYVESDGQLLILRRNPSDPSLSLPAMRSAPPAASAALLGSRPAPAVVRQGTISGRVVEEATLRPLAGAQVSIPETNQGALTNPEGRFVLENVPVGVATVRAQMIGFATAEQTVTVTEGGSSVVNFALEQQAVPLDAVVVTGTAGVTRRLELGNALAQIDADVVETQPIEDVSDLLRGRGAGVVVHGGQGTVGTATTIKIRGSSTMRLGNDGPL